MEYSNSNGLVFGKTSTAENSTFTSNRCGESEFFKPRTRVVIKLERLTWPKFSLILLWKILKALSYFPELWGWRDGNQHHHNHHSQVITSPLLSISVAAFVNILFVNFDNFMNLINWTIRLKSFKMEGRFLFCYILNGDFYCLNIGMQPT